MHTKSSMRIVVKKAPLVLCFILPVFALLSDNVKISNCSQVLNYKLNGFEYATNQRDMAIMNCGQGNYCFSYSYIDDLAYVKANPMARLPVIGDSSIQSTGIGLAPGWYSGGFLKIIINGKSVYAKTSTMDIIEKDDYGALEFSWSFDVGRAKAVFTAQKDDDRIYCQITLDPQGEIKSFQVVFFALPGHYGTNTYGSNKLDRWCSTAENNWQNLTDGPGPRAFDTKEANWLLFYDSQSNERGTAAVLFDPEQVRTGRQFFIGELISGVEFTIEPRFTSAHFVIWGFPDDYKTAEMAYGYLNENSDKMLKELKRFKF